MRLWFATSSEIPVYRQLVTQITLAILSGELKPGDRLPSTRDLAPFRTSSQYHQLRLQAA